MEINKNNRFATKKLSEIIITNHNRVTSKTHVEKLVKKIEESKDVTPLLLSSDLELVDGHHRYEACRKLGITKVHVIINKDIDQSNIAEYIIKFNNTQKAWVTKDFVKVYGLDEYNEFVKIANSQLMSSCFGLTSPKIKNGTAKPLNTHPDYPELVKFIEVYKEIKAFIKEKQKSKLMKKNPSRWFPTTMWTIYKNYEHLDLDIVKEVLSNSGDDIMVLGAQDRQMIYFADRYNHFAGYNKNSKERILLSSDGAFIK